MLDWGVDPPTDGGGGGGTERRQYWKNWRLDRVRKEIKYERTLLVFLLNLLLMIPSHKRSTNVPTGAFLP